MRPDLVAFELETFEWVDERLEVAGRWRGVGARRLSRPVLTIETASARRKRIVALPGGQMGATGETWRADFAWPGDPGEITGAALEVGGNLLVDLPLPDRKRRRRRRSSQDTSDDVLRGEVGALRSQIERLRAELAGREREILMLREQLDVRDDAPPGDAAADDSAHTIELQRLAELRDAEASRAENLTIEIDRVAQERDAAHAAADEAVAAERERWQVDLGDLRQSFADAAAEAEATRDKHLAEVAGLEAQLRIERAEVARLLAAAAARDTGEVAAEPRPAAPAGPPTPTQAMPAHDAQSDAEPEAEPQDTVETDALAEPGEPGEEPTPTARFTAWVRETIGPELGAAPAVAAAVAATEPGSNGSVARDSRFTSWLRGPTAPADDAGTGELDGPAEPGAAVAEPEDEAAVGDKPATLSSRIPAWLRGAPPAATDESEEEAAVAESEEEAAVAEPEDAASAEPEGAASAEPEDAAIAPAPEQETVADAPEDVTVADAPDDVTVADDPENETVADEPDDVTVADEPVADTAEREPVGDDARADEVRAAALAASPVERFAAEPPAAEDERDEDERDDGDRGVNWPKLDAEALAGLRERFRRPPREEGPAHVPESRAAAGRPRTARPIRTRTERRVRHGATIAAGRTSAEVWALRVIAAILVIVLLTTFVLLLASIA